MVVIERVVNLFLRKKPVICVHFLSKELVPVRLSSCAEADRF